MWGVGTLGSRSGPRCLSSGRCLVGFRRTEMGRGDAYSSFIRGWGRLWDQLAVVTAIDTQITPGSCHTGRGRGSGGYLWNAMGHC